MRCSAINGTLIAFLLLRLKDHCGGMGRKIMKARGHGELEPCIQIWQECSTQELTAVVVYARHPQDLASQHSSMWRIGSQGLLHLVEKFTVNRFWEKEESVVFNGVAPGRSRHYSSCSSYLEYKGRAHWNQWNACNKSTWGYFGFREGCVSGKS